ncbi:MAG: bifunctional glycosyltransferase/CDP-glycerol:glycerophosphate glycerophosphotransferase [Marmoricola sp.]
MNDARSRPRFTLVSAVHDVADFLPDYLASLEAQTFPADRFEVVLVDDGATDASPGLLDAWAARRRGTVQVVHQQNAGQGAARNAGLALARGEWVSFPDPDDVLDPDYLTAVDRFLLAHPGTDLVAANRWSLRDGRLANDHPLRWMFHYDRLVDLVADGRSFQGSAPAAFFRGDRLRATGQRFDPRIRPIFEDGHFTIRYLLGFDRPLAGFLQSARYHYRRRTDKSSTLQRSRAHPGRYAEVLEHGYLDVVDAARERFGRLPMWLQNHLVFDLSFYFTMTDSRVPAGAPTDGPAAERFHHLMRQALDALDLDDVVPHASAPVARIPRYVLQHGYRDEPWHEPFVLLEELDGRQRLVRATYFHTGDRPVEQVLADGEPIEPVHAKTRDLEYVGRRLLHQRILWLPAGRTLQVRLDDEPVPLVFQRPPFPVVAAQPGLVRWELGTVAGRRAKERAALADPVPTSRLARQAARRIGTERVGRRYGGAWVLMDRIHDAGDSGEILFRYLREHHRDVNAWFVLEKGTPEWERFRREGHADRLVAHGSLEWLLLMANAEHLISSHADEAVMNPPAVLELMRPRWRFTFLQHGVIKDDLSSWLNSKDIDLFVTSTVQEHASIAGDHTPYRFTTREVQLTGLPRFDRLRSVGEALPPGARDLVVVAPTWRKDLLPTMETGTQRRDIDVERALASTFLRSWTAFLRSPELAAAATRHGARVGFLPHPNLQPLLPRLDLPDHVEPLAYDGDVQALFARTRVLVTDFSSVAFNAAYLDRPVVYFQFDRDEVLGGGHVGRAGYFRYERDGFGPVTTTAEEAVAATVGALDHGGTPAPPYAHRIAATFPDRDGRCCERVVEALRAINRSQADRPPVPTPRIGADGAVEPAVEESR